MSQSLAPAVAAGGAPLPRSRRLLRAVAVGACLPYLALKTAWVAGSHVGVPAGSVLLDHPTETAVANVLTILMDGAVIVLALLLTRPWGRGVPAWLLAAPMWVATGLLAPIMAGYPLQLLVRAFGGQSPAGTATGADEPFLHAWVFAVVYTGFIVQGLALGSLFVLYARDRWGRLWRGRMWDLSAGTTGTAQRVVAVAAAVLALFPLALRALWACGGTAGLSAGVVAGRGSDFHVLESLYVVFLLAAVGGGLLLAFRRTPALPVRVPLVLAGVGSGAVACWGGWMAAAALLSPGDPADRPTGLMLLAYAGQMIVGLLVATVGARFLVARSVLGARSAGAVKSPVT
ncbi:hypothetical protein [Streptomyces griseomycini]|uniref:LigA protein n=1 Tax=Streptomyces griseomycini TaxID=66895 RepID=A0A7W7PN51_9ACTN|nr:hypothetical protein [Streptomyces griseomycini]MBB4896072.1 hypothetical protein [Streptomyces griseomycini]GGR39950.1 hypothetical protein GCM10015536_52220 [Streptomyces griseomycini]